MGIVGRRVRLSGLVQGVFYRVWSQGQARELGVSGWVRNCPDGSVEAHLSGEEDDVARLIDRMRRGPSNARVDELAVEEEAAEEPGRFEVRP
ncbi:MAG: acylphosphatase [Sphingomicrobium sp.]